jgi:WD40 repeat protein
MMGPGDEEDLDLSEVPQFTEIWQCELDEAIICMCMSPSTHLLAAGTVDNEITVVDAASGLVVCGLAGHAGGTNDLAFMGNDRLISCGEDGKVVLWDLKAKRAVFEAAVEGTGADK